MHKKAIPPLGNSAGFTLLEIIAVMVIMSILAVVAVPKYFDLQEQARNKAMETAMAEAIGRVNSYFATQVLGGTLPSEIDYQTNDPLGTDMGDFTLAVVDGHGTTGEGDEATVVTDPSCPEDATSVSAGCILLTVTPNPGTAVANAEPLTKQIVRPGF